MCGELWPELRGWWGWMCPCARFAWPSALPLLTEVVICGRKTKHIPGRPYLMWKKCSDRPAQLKQDLFTARTLQLKLFGFFSCFPWFFCWMWDKLSCFLTPHQTGALLLQFEISFLKKKMLISQLLPDFLRCHLCESPENSLWATSLCCKTCVEKRVQSGGSLLVCIPGS